MMSITYLLFVVTKHGACWYQQAAETANAPEDWRIRMEQAAKKLGRGAQAAQEPDRQSQKTTWETRGLHARTLCMCLSGKAN